MYHGVLFKKTTTKSPFVREVRIPAKLISVK
jgi:hypothetical protein